MQTIKFRAKNDETGEWIYGGGVIEGKGGWAMLHLNQYGDLTLTGIDRNTVGQYINVKGNRDKKEIELYEGDIVKAWSAGSSGTFLIKFRNESAPIWLLWPNFQSNQHWNIHASCLGRKVDDFHDDLEVIGNIHDNPELTP